MKMTLSEEIDFLRTIEGRVDPSVREAIEARIAWITKNMHDQNKETGASTPSINDHLAS